MFLRTVGPFGGCGDEAIEEVLKFASNTAVSYQIDQCILIGDRSANAHTEVKLKRIYKGRALWSTTQFHFPIPYEVEVN